MRLGTARHPRNCKSCAENNKKGAPVWDLLVPGATRTTRHYLSFTAEKGRAAQLSTSCCSYAARLGNLRQRRDQKFNFSAICIMRGSRALVTWPKVLEVKLPEGLLN
jgi:hypothetical protein